MKRIPFLAMFIITSVTLLSPASAQEKTAPPAQPSASKSEMSSMMPMMSEHEMAGMRSMCGAMMGPMMGHCMAASDDGGVIVMAGCKLMKYDRNLNLVKEVQLTMDMQRMSEMMSQMMAMCSRAGAAMHTETCAGGGSMPKGEMRKGGMNEKK